MFLYLFNSNLFLFDSLGYQELAEDLLILKGMCKFVYLLFKSMQSLKQICKYFLQLMVEAGGGDIKLLEVQVVCDINYSHHHLKFDEKHSEANYRIF